MSTDCPFRLLSVFQGEDVSFQRRQGRPLSPETSVSYFRRTTESLSKAAHFSTAFSFKDSAAISVSSTFCTPQCPERSSYIALWSCGFTSLGCWKPWRHRYPQCHSVVKTHLSVGLQDPRVIQVNFLSHCQIVFHWDVCSPFSISHLEEAASFCCPGGGPSIAPATQGTTRFGRMKSQTHSPQLISTELVQTCSAWTVNMAQ